MDTKKGNTPTHVGKTATTYGVSTDKKKHPHARGEDPLRLPVFLGIRETPPRTWGRLL